MTQPPQWPGAQPGHPAPEPQSASAPPAAASAPPAAADEAWRSSETSVFPGPDFIDGPPPAVPTEFPPVGAYPGEPGHPAPPPDQTQATPQDRTQATPQEPQDRTQVIDPVPTWQQQAPPHQAWHAQHEKPGEWQHQPPEHLAYQHSPPPELHPNGEPIWSGPQPQYQLPPPRPKRRAALWVSLALVFTLLLCAGGAVSAYFLLRDADAKGAADPATAVDQFLTAVYTQQDAKAAEELVCREAKDTPQLTARVDQIKAYATEYDGPAFRWNTPAVTGQSEETATVSVQLTMSTDDEKSSQQQLTFTTIRKTGWLVCEIGG